MLLAMVFVLLSWVYNSDGKYMVNRYYDSTKNFVGDKNENDHYKNDSSMIL